MKKICFLIGVISFWLFSNNTFAIFSDVSEDSENFKAIEWLSKNGVIQGYENNSFKPEQHVNRAEFLKILFETVGMDGKFVTLPFPDVQKNAWYTKYVMEAYDKGIINGYPDKTFKPENNINVAEALKIISEAFFDVDQMYLNDEDFIYCPNGNLSFDELFFPQHPSSIDKNVWYWKYVHVGGEICLYDFNINSSSFGAYWLTENITRGDVAELIYRAKTIKDNDNQKYTDTLTPGDIDKTPKLIVPSISTKDLIREYNNSNFGISFNYPIFFSQTIENENIISFKNDSCESTGTLCIKGIDSFFVRMEKNTNQKTIEDLYEIAKKSNNYSKTAIVTNPTNNSDTDKMIRMEYATNNLTQNFGYEYQIVSENNLYFIVFNQSQSEITGYDNNGDPIIIGTDKYDPLGDMIIKTFQISQ